jgi:predicted transposase YbfD/YdcC
MDLNRFIYYFEERMQSIDRTKILAKASKKDVLYLAYLVKSEVPDFRNKNSILYNLEDIIIVAFFATLSGLKNYCDIVDYGKYHLKYFKKTLGIEVIPSHDTFRRIFMLLDSNHFEVVLVKYLTSFFDKLENASHKNNKTKLKQYALDGKDLTGTGQNIGNDSKVNNIQILNVMDLSTGICIHSEDIDCKTNEIPAAQDFLKTICLENTVISADAIHAQVKTLEIISNKNGFYLIGLKENQGNCYGLAKTLFKDKYDELRNDSSTYLLEPEEKANNKKIIREYYKIPITNKNIYLVDKFKSLKSIGVCVKTTEEIHKTEGINKKNVEIRYYISNLDSVEIISEVIRGHWGIENRLHWCLDVVLKEDELQIQNRNEIKNRSTLNKFALTLLKMTKIVMGITSYKMSSNRFNRNPEYINEILSILSSKQLIMILKGGSVKD